MLKLHGQHHHFATNFKLIIHISAPSSISSLRKLSKLTLVRLLVQKKKKIIILIIKKKKEDCQYSLNGPLEIIFLLTNLLFIYRLFCREVNVIFCKELKKIGNAKMSRTMGREGGWNVEEGEFVEQANDDVDVRTPLISDPCHPR